MKPIIIHPRRTISVIAAAVILTASAGFGAEQKPAQSGKVRPTSGKGDVKLVDAAGLKTAEHVYKRTPQGEFKLYFHFPADWQATDRRPAILFFFGGGWKNGTAAQFFPQAEYFATRGLVTVRADYRVLNQHGTTPDKCVEDAKSAMRWLRSHAAEFGVDPEKLISSGGSAGGHLAAAVALCEGFDAPGDDVKISPRPAALVLFNPALNLTTLGKVTNAAGADITEKFSPTLFLKKGGVPAVMFFGTADKLKEQGDEFLKKSRALGNRCEQFTAADLGHGFFNKQPWTTATAIAADKFLAALGYLKGAPTLAAPAGAELREEK